MKAGNGSWADFKAICIARKNLNIQYEDLGPVVRVVGPDSNSINWVIILRKTQDDDVTANPDYTDFLANVEPTCNWAIGVRPYWAATPDAQLAGKGFIMPCDKATLLVPSKLTTCYIKWDWAHYTNGGEWWTVGSVDGDKMVVDFVDKDNLLNVPGFDANNPTVLVTPPYFDEWNVVGADRVKSKFETPYAAKPPQGMYLRIRYYAIGQLVDPKLYLNLFKHKPL